MSRGARTRLETGIYQDQYGIAACVTVGTLTSEYRFKPDAEREDIRRWRVGERFRLMGELAARGGPPPTDTLTRDVDRYLKEREGRPGYKADRSHLKAWMARYGELPTSRLTTAHVQLAIVEWQQAGLAPQTIKHRRRALSQLHRRFNGKTPNPCEDVTAPPVARPGPRPTAKPVIVKVAERLKQGDAKTYARFLVLAHTLARPVELMRACPDDLHLERQLWYVRTAKGGEPRTIPLTAEGVHALEAFKAADAWGPYDTSRHAKRLHRAGWPKGERPYNLRHTGAMEILEQGCDLADVQGILGHKSIDTTARYYARPSLARLRKAVNKRKINLEGL